MGEKGRIYEMKGNKNNSKRKKNSLEEEGNWP